MPADRFRYVKEIAMSDAKLFRVYWKKTGEKEYKAGHWGFVKAKDKEDAQRIMQQNLQNGNEVTEVFEAYEHQITPSAICVNFANKSEPLGFG